MREYFECDTFSVMFIVILFDFSSSSFFFRLRNTRDHVAVVLFVCGLCGKRFEFHMFMNSISLGFHHFWMVGWSVGSVGSVGGTVDRSVQ